MGRFLVKRLALAAITLVLLSIIVFAAAVSSLLLHIDHRLHRRV